ncbi:MAG: hypothetical protein ACKVP0_16035 [Pirellulaceae bacterium]
MSFSNSDHSSGRLTILYASSVLIAIAICIRCLIWNMFVGGGISFILLAVCAFFLPYWLKQDGNPARASLAPWQQFCRRVIGGLLAGCITLCVVMTPVMLLDRGFPTMQILPRAPRLFLYIGIPLGAVSWGLWLGLSAPRANATTAEPRDWQFSLRTVFIMLTLALIDLGFWLRDAEAGLWVGWAFVTSYAWATHTVAAIRVGNQEPNPVPRLYPARLAITMFASFVIALSVTIAFGITCTAVVFPIGAFTYSPHSNSWLFFPLLLTMGSTFGFAAAALWLRVAWPRR